MKGVLITSETAGSYSAARNVLVRESIQTLLRKDFTTANMIGKYIDVKFADAHLDIPSTFGMTQKQERIDHEKNLRSLIGWSEGARKLQFEHVKLDEVACIIGLAATNSGVPNNMGDVTMNSYRYYDVLKMISGPDFDTSGTFELKENTPVQVRYFRFRYFRFITSQLKRYIRDFEYEQVLASLYTMQAYQLMPCLAAAFRLKEREEGWDKIELAYPIIELAGWSEQQHNDLLLNTRIRETPEWMKIVPLMDDEHQFLNQTLETAVINLPFEETGYDAPEVYKMYRWMNAAWMWNYSVLDYYDTFVQNFWTVLKSYVGSVDTVVYQTSFEVMIKGYFLAEPSFAKIDSDGKLDADGSPATLLAIYEDVVSPGNWGFVKNSVTDMKEPNALVQLNHSDISKAISTMDNIQKASITEIFTPILDLTERRQRIKKAFKIGKQLPLYYRIVGDEVVYSSLEQTS